MTFDTERLQFLVVSPLKPKMSRHWTEIVAEKRANREAKLQKIYGDSPPDPRVLVVEDIQDLTKLLDTGEFTAETVILTFIQK